MPASDSTSPSPSSPIDDAVKTFQKEKKRIVKERTANIKKIIAEIDEQKTDTIKQRIAQMP